MTSFDAKIKLNEFGQRELSAKQKKDLFFSDLLLVKNLMRVKYINERNTAGEKETPVIVRDMTATEAYEALITDYPQLQGDVALVAMAHLRKEYKERK
jgi:hypothetical protein